MLKKRVRAYGDRFKWTHKNAKLGRKVMEPQSVEWKKQIRKHAEELHKLLLQTPNDYILASLAVQLESSILSNQAFKETGSA